MECHAREPVALNQTSAWDDLPKKRGGRLGESRYNSIDCGTLGWCIGCLYCFLVHLEVARRNVTAWMRILVVFLGGEGLVKS